jgi:hypothetical protein
MAHPLPAAFADLQSFADRYALTPSTSATPSA